MLSKIRTTTAITLVAAFSFAASAAPASAAVVIVKEAGGWGHYNCDIGNGVYIKDGSTWKENGHTYTCKNGKIETARVSSGGGVRPVGEPPKSAPEPSSTPPARGTTASSPPPAAK